MADIFQGLSGNPMIYPTYGSGADQFQATMPAVGGGLTGISGGINLDSLRDMLGKLGIGGGGAAGAASTPFGFNLGTGQLVLGGLSSIGNLLQSFQANSLANKQYKFARDMGEANLTNQIKSYNTRLEDRVRARAFTEGQDANYVNDYVAKNRLTR